MNLTNHFLISMPHLNDGIFKRAVVLICEHNQDGAVGIAINKSSGIDLQTLFQRINLKLNRPDLLQHEVHLGGPVQIERGFVLHEKIIPHTDFEIENNQFENQSIYTASLQIEGQLELTTSFDILESIAMDAGPQKILFALGCSSWSEGQIEEEIAQNSWLITPANQNIIFTVPLEERYEQALALLGIREDQLTSSFGKA